jgi:16S rRNA (adenine1518-N6/adenine1519-N6)-dimethyltransferase
MRLQELKALLDAHGLAPQARFGQNFLVDPALLAAIPRDAGVQAGEMVIEIGPGAGALTERLLAAGARVVAVEVDHGLARLLRERLAGPLADGSLQLLEGDALGPAETLHAGLEALLAGLAEPPRLVANLPYAISGPFLARLPGRPLAGATLLLQREVAEKAAGPAGGEWSPLAVRLALAFRAELGRRVPAEVFWPRPRIESAFLQLRPRPDAPDAAGFARLAAALRLAFGQRRKLLLPRLERELPQWASALREAGVAPEARPGELEPATWLAALRRVQ